MFNITDPVVTLLGLPLFFDGEYSGSGVSDVSADAVVAVVAVPEPFTASSVLACDGFNITAFAQANLSGNTALNSDLVIGVQGAAVLTAEATLSVSTTIVNLAASVVVGTSNLVATSTRLFFVTKDLSSESNLVAKENLVNFVEGSPLIGQSNLVATMFEPLNVLVLPTVEYQYSKVRLMQFYGIDSGQSLIITGTNGRIVEYQTGTEIEAADYYFGGGRRHVLDAAEVTAVTNAGFGELITIEGVPSGV
jgi:hypothetical protein